MSRLGPSFYVIITLSVVILAVFATLSLRQGGLPGLKDSPSATVHGVPITGKTGAD